MSGGRSMQQLFDHYTTGAASASGSQSNDDSRGGGGGGGGHDFSDVFTSPGYDEYGFARARQHTHQPCYDDMEGDRSGGIDHFSSIHHVAAAASPPPSAAGTNFTYQPSSARLFVPFSAPAPSSPTPASPAPAKQQPQQQPQQQSTRTSGAVCASPAPGGAPVLPPGIAAARPRRVSILDKQPPALQTQPVTSAPTTPTNTTSPSASVSSPAGGYRRGYSFSGAGAFTPAAQQQQPPPPPSPPVVGAPRSAAADEPVSIELPVPAVSPGDGRTASAPPPPQPPPQPQAAPSAAVQQQYRFTYTNDWMRNRAGAQQQQQQQQQQQSSSAIAGARVGESNTSSGNALGGGTFADLVMDEVYLANFDPEERATIRRLHKQHEDMAAFADRIDSLLRTRPKYTVVEEPSAPEKEQRERRAAPPSASASASGSGSAAGDAQPAAKAPVPRSFAELAQRSPKVGRPKSRSRSRRGGGGDSDAAIAIGSLYAGMLDGSSTGGGSADDDNEDSDDDDGGSGSDDGDRDPSETNSAHSGSESRGRGAEKKTRASSASESAAAAAGPNPELLYRALKISTREYQLYCALQRQQRDQERQLWEREYVNKQRARERERERQAAAEAAMLVQRAGSGRNAAVQNWRAGGGSPSRSPSRRPPPPAEGEPFASLAVDSVRYHLEQLRQRPHFYDFVMRHGLQRAKEALDRGDALSTEAGDDAADAKSSDGEGRNTTGAGAGAGGGPPGRETEQQRAKRCLDKLSALAAELSGKGKAKPAAAAAAAPPTGAVPTSKELRAQLQSLSASDAEEDDADGGAGPDDADELDGIARRDPRRYYGSEDGGDLDSRSDLDSCLRQGREDARRDLRHFVGSKRHELRVSQAGTLSATAGASPSKHVRRGADGRLRAFLIDEDGNEFDLHSDVSSVGRGDTSGGANATGGGGANASGAARGLVLDTPSFAKAGAFRPPSDDDDDDRGAGGGAGRKEAQGRGGKASSADEKARTDAALAKWRMRQHENRVPAPPSPAEKLKEERIDRISKAAADQRRLADLLGFNPDPAAGSDGPSATTAQRSAAPSVILSAADVDDDHLRRALFGGGGAVGARPLATRAPASDQGFDIRSTSSSAQNSKLWGSAAGSAANAPAATVPAAALEPFDFEL